MIPDPCFQLRAFGEGRGADGEERGYGDDAPRITPPRGQRNRSLQNQYLDPQHDAANIAPPDLFASARQIQAVMFHLFKIPDATPEHQLERRFAFGTLLAQALGLPEYSEVGGVLLPPGENWSLQNYLNRRFNTGISHAASTIRIAAGS